ncbi:hypothetical protein PoB_000873400 [Plakobranchus ocellatus]|uniref:Uncharacterized protein n=1 Tax=Plakobranchus ocellatus TaxID=259542 RepID=A0AAV3YGU7_9GAST|nr:hypothetical protein PoB_000873400 [Plakobranchus ocellatus]
MWPWIDCSELLFIKKRYGIKLRTTFCFIARQNSTLWAGRKESCRWRYIWPYVRLREEIISWDPEICRFYDVISSKEIEHIKNLARDKVRHNQIHNNRHNGIFDH